MADAVADGVDVVEPLAEAPPPTPAAAPMPTHATPTAAVAAGSPLGAAATPRQPPPASAIAVAADTPATPGSALASGGSAAGRKRPRLSVAVANSLHAEEGDGKAAVIAPNAWWRVVTAAAPAAGSSALLGPMPVSAPAGAPHAGAPAATAAAATAAAHAPPSSSSFVGAGAGGGGGSGGGGGGLASQDTPRTRFHPCLGTLWLQRLMVTPCRHALTCMRGRYCGMIHVPLAARHPHRPLPRRRRRQAAHPPHQLPQQQLLRWAGRQLPSARAVLEEKMVQHRH